MDNSVAQDELQQAINDITNAANASANDSTDAVAQIEKRIKGNKPKEEKQNDHHETAMKLVQNMQQNGLGPIPAPEAPSMPEIPEMPSFMMQPEVNTINMNPTSEKKAAKTEVKEISDASLKSVKEKALNDLRPLMDKIEMDADKKYSIYREILETSNDTSVIAPLYETISGLSDETQKAEALLYVIEKINNLG